MLKIVALPAALVVVLATSACTNPYDPSQRAAGGALIGAGTGATLGAIAGGGRGAVIGAIAGGLVGGAAGVATTPQAPPIYAPEPSYGYPRQPLK